MSEPKTSQFAQVSPFLWASLAWLAVGLALVTHPSPPESARLGAAWLVGLWLLCLVDLLALAKAVAAVIKVVGTEGEKRVPLVIQASYWSFLKIACLGIFTVVLFRGRTIPSNALLLGMGTLVIVPLIGGFFWSRNQVQSDE